MTRPTSVSARALLFWVTALLIAAAAGAPVAVARPSTFGVATLTPAVSTVPRPSQTATVGPASVSLESSSFAVPLDEPYAFTATVNTAEKIDQASLVFRVYRPSGRMMIQRTKIFNDVEPGTVTETFERQTDDLGLRPGTYPVSVDVRISAGGQVFSETVESELLVYDPDKADVTVVLAARVSSQPLADPQGRFVADPGRYTRARDDVRALSRWVLTDESARLTLAVSPLMLEEWTTVAGGYRLLEPEGATSVPASDAVPVAYADTLRLLDDARKTGRLELCALGYSDPDLAALAAHKMGDDTVTQYATGAQVLGQALPGSAPSTGTVSAGGEIPVAAAGELPELGVTHAVVSRENARRGKNPATPGLHRVKDTKLTVLVEDTELSKAASDTAAFVERALRIRLAAPGRVATVRAEVGAGSLEATTVIAAAQAVAAQPWAGLSTASAAASGKPGNEVTLQTTGDAGAAAPAGYWDDVATSRAWAGGIAAATGPASGRARSAERSSLIAQCSAWSGPDDDWAMADRGRAYANYATRLATAVLGRVALKVNSVTLPGTEGKVPLTITNGSNATLRVRLGVTPRGGLSVEDRRIQSVELMPKDNFVEVPVELRNAISGRLTVSVYAGSVLLDRQTITVTASYLDRIVLIVGVVVVLLGLLFYVIRRAKSADKIDVE